MDKPLTTLPTTAARNTEEILVQGLRSRDEKAISTLYDNYAAALYGVALKIVKRDDLAEDVLQECFVKIWSSIDQYDEAKGRLFTWMLNICRNQAIDKIRSRSYRVGLKTQDLDNSFVASLNSASDIQPDHIGIKEITAKLNPDQKIVIDMMYFEGFSQSEVAEELNIPLGTVKTRARSAIKFLSKLIK